MGTAHYILVVIQNSKITIGEVSSASSYIYFLSK